MHNEAQFREWLLKSGKTGAAASYPKAIQIISDHYSKQTGRSSDIYAIADQHLISQIAHDYSQSGKYSEFGYEQHGRFRAAIGRYSEFFVQNKDKTSPEGQPAPPPPEPVETQAIPNFAYEKDLKVTLCAQVSDLFPGYKIFGPELTGIEYTIEGRRIDVLLEQIEGTDLLAVELKAGAADFKVFGQISMYMGLLITEFPSRRVSGVIVAGAIEPSLKQACITTDRIILKTYRMSLELDDA